MIAPTASITAIIRNARMISSLSCISERGVGEKLFGFVLFLGVSSDIVLP